MLHHPLSLIGACHALPKGVLERVENAVKKKNPSGVKCSKSSSRRESERASEKAFDGESESERERERGRWGGQRE
jgi:hypothetical protein